jgi:hypothetical protein
MRGYAVPVAPPRPSARWARMGQPDPLDDVTDAVGQLADSLTSTVNALSAEVELLRAGRKGEIANVGHLPPGEVLNEIARAADEVASIADSVLMASLAGYAEPYREALESASQRATTLAQAARLQGAEPLTAGNESAAEDHFLAHVEDARDLRDGAEMLVVGMENGVVPVQEPGETEIMVAEGVLGGIGALVLGGLLIYLVAS